MDDAAYNAIADRINALVAKWKPVLHLGRWTVNVVVLRAGFPRKDKDEDGAFRNIAKAEVKWEYLEAQLRFDAPEAASLPDEDLEDAVVHELVHVLTYEFREFSLDQCSQCGSTRMVPDGAEKHEERVVSELTALIRELAAQGGASA